MFFFIACLLTLFFIIILFVPTTLQIPMTMKLNLLLLIFIVELVAAVTNYNLGSAPVSRYSLKTGTYSPVAATRVCNDNCYSFYEGELFCGKFDSNVSETDYLNCLCLNKQYRSNFEGCNCKSESEVNYFDWKSSCSDISSVKNYLLPTTQLGTCNSHCSAYQTIPAECLVYESGKYQEDQVCICQNAEFWYHYENCDCLDFGDIDHEYEDICYYATNSFVTSDDYYDSFFATYTEGSFESILEKGSFLAEQKGSITSGLASKTETSKVSTTTFSSNGTSSGTTNGDTRAETKSSTSTQTSSSDKNSSQINSISSTGVANFVASFGMGTLLLFVFSLC